MSQESRKIRFGLWYDFRNPTQWRQPSNRLYRDILHQIAWSENNGFDDVWLSEHHFIEDGYLPSIARRLGWELPPAHLGQVEGVRRRRL